MKVELENRDVFNNIKGLLGIQVSKLRNILEKFEHDLLYNPIFNKSRDKAKTVNSMIYTFMLNNTNKNTVVTLVKHLDLEAELNFTEFVPIKCGLF